MTQIAIFASGRGSNFRSIYQHIKKGTIPAEISCLITDNKKAGAIEFAVQNEISYHVIHPKEFSSTEEFGNSLLKILDASNVDWIVLAGFLKKIPDNVVSKYSDRILNIHPALLPAFGGKGMYGAHVHKAVFDSGCKVSGVTVHLVNNEYDAGPIVEQQAVNIADCHSPEDIASAVLAVEHQIYPKVLKKVLTKKYQIEGKRVVFFSEGSNIL